MGALSLSGHPTTVAKSGTGSVEATGTSGEGVEHDQEDEDTDFEDALPSLSHLKKDNVS